MKRYQERTLWALALCASVGLWAVVGAQAPSRIAAPGTPAVSPAAGTDTFDSIAEIQPFSGDGQTDFGLIDLVGPTTVVRGNPQRGPQPRTYQIDTELVSMNLTGFSSMLGGDVTVRESPTRASTGRITGPSKVGFPANSFFDVFVEIDVPGIGRLHNEQAVRLISIIHGIPPIEDAYNAPENLAVPLLDSQGIVRALLGHVQHVPCQPSHRKIKRELILLEKKLDLLLQIVDGDG
ncbi:MAG: hypothetical protein HY320_04925 [Armatimonadetes bacterium]|nr:hypothetical protein [Armatimonadota bacterium]